MKKLFASFFPAVLVILMMTSCCNNRRYESVAGDPMQSRIYTLDNGLKVYLSVNKETPRIQTYIAVRVGGKNDPAETTGLAHYLEHLMFKGTENFGTQNYAEEKPLLDQIETLFEVYRTKTDEAERTAIYRQIDSLSYEASKLSIPNEYDKLMASIGAEGSNAFTSYDVTAYVEDIPANQLDNWAKIQAERFKHHVIRGFHTELETVYEEKNMSLASDGNKVFDGILEASFANHPYGKQSVIGTQEHLKNPSITNIKEYYKKWYVPNNMAICMSGDFDFDEAMDIIEKYFGDMQPNPELQMMEYEPEKEITEPIVRETWGLESEMLAIAWRFPGASSDEALMMSIIDALLNNGKAGLLDLNLMQEQKVLWAYSFPLLLSDYSLHLVQAAPKEGQTLDDVKDLILEQFAHLRNGEWDESLLTASIANLKLDAQVSLEDNDSRAYTMVDAFINGTPWEDVVNRIERMEKITKQDVMDFANKYFTDNNYAVLYKRQGEDPNLKNIDKPAITPIFMNRDTASTFLRDVQATVVNPIEPKFVDFDKEVSKGTIGQLPFLYHKNNLNDVFVLQYIFDFGSNENKLLPIAANYMDFLGTSNMSATEIKQALYSLACSYYINVSDTKTTIHLYGLSENMEKAITLLEELLSDAIPNQEAYENLVSDILKSRDDAKTNQDESIYRLQEYALYGANTPSKNILSKKELENLNPTTLLQTIRQLSASYHQITCYSPMEMEDAKAIVQHTHKFAEEIAHVKKNEAYKYKPTTENIVYIAPYDANQIYLMSASIGNETFDVKELPAITLYNTYFGGNMSGIVFQEMREARALAYHASAYISEPSRKEEPCIYKTFIATQNDKMIDAITTFDEIINNMPVSQKAFDIAKESLISHLRTERISGGEILSYYLSQQELGLTQDSRRQLYEAVLAMTLEDVVEYQQAKVKGLKYTTCVLGREADLDMKSLEKWGKIIRLTQEELFGY